MDIKNLAKLNNIIANPVTKGIYFNPYFKFPLFIIAIIKDPKIVVIKIFTYENTKRKSWDITICETGIPEADEEPSIKNPDNNA